MIRVGIIGGNGYTGKELLSILLRHSEVSISYVISRKEAGMRVSEVFPSLDCDLIFSDIGAIDTETDVVFSCLPPTTSAEYAVKLPASTKLIDLSADFRYSDISVYERTYKTQHPCPGLNSSAVYGLSELNRSKIKEARIVGNPGCYTTCALLSLYPLFKDGLITSDRLIIDAKSGTSGAGRKAELSFSYCEVNESFKAYAVTTHRHTSEIEHILYSLTGKETGVCFTPHLLPINRGILCTIYAELSCLDITEEKIYNSYGIYGSERFIKVLKTLPEIKDVINGNYFHLGFKLDVKNRQIIIVSVLDNLIKGAAGQAVQNMNIMFGCPEHTALI